MIAHIGMPKSATTFLQTKYFPKLDGYNFYTPEFNHDSRLDSLFSYNKAFGGGNVGGN